MTKLFVGGLPYSVTSDELRNIFSNFGSVASATVITDKFTGQSKGFGFVEFENDNEAQEAIKDLNDSDLNGRKIAVSIARPKEERPSGDRFNRNSNFHGGFNPGRRGNDRNRR